MARLRATSGPGTRDHTLFLKPPPLDSAAPSAADASQRQSEAKRMGIAGGRATVILHRSCAGDARYWALECR
jgi:hypothetical protein